MEDLASQATRAPLISIVTVVYNGEATIEGTLRSVREQSYPNVEHIVIDGGSTDGTLEVIQRHADTLGFWISEPDRGIYDAMNKGIARARGEWIHFLNVGDLFLGKDTLQELFAEDHSAEWSDSEEGRPADLVYGNHQSDYGYFQRIHIPPPLRKISKGMVFSHQAMFVRTTHMKEHPFDLRYRLSSDFDFIYRLFRRHARFVYVNQVIASLEAGGISEVTITKTHAERWAIARGYERSVSRLLLDADYALNLARLHLIQLTKKVLPAPLSRWLTRLKYGKIAGRG